MIGKLTGTIDSYGEDHVVLDVNGVGYLVHASGRTLQGLPKAGEPASLSIETHVREDAIRLFGFLTVAEREWFRLLQSVQGVGSKVALAILSTLSSGELATALAVGDKAAIGRAPGVGPKLAQRMASELKDKVPAFAAVDPAIAGLSGDLAAKGGPLSDAVSALVNLGYSQSQATAAVATASKGLGAEAATSALIRASLKELAS